MSADIVIKKENHSNRLDKEEERELLRSNFDTLILEGRENENNEWRESGFLGSWFGWATNLFFWIMSPIYESSGSLIDIAEVQDMDVEFTKKGDYELINKASIPLRLISLIAFYGLFLMSMAYGMYSNGYYYGIFLPSLLLLGAITVPILILRIYNSRYAQTENRDEKIAEKTEEASEEGNVLVIVGKSHEIERFISEEKDYCVKNAKSTQKTFSSILDYISRILKSYFILLSLFLVVREIMSIAVSFA